MENYIIESNLNGQTRTTAANGRTFADTVFENVCGQMKRSKERKYVTVTMYALEGDSVRFIKAWKKPQYKPKGGVLN